MARANKYFAPQDQKYGAAQNAGALSNRVMDKMIEKVKKKTSENYFSNKEAQSYVVPLPEKIMPDNQAQSVDDLVENKGSTRSRSSSGSIPRRIIPTPTPGGTSTPTIPTRKSSNTFEYLVGEALQGIRDSLVKDPLDPTYQFSRKIGSKLIRESNHAIDIILQEAAIIAIYALGQSILGKKIPKL